MGVQSTINFIDQRSSSIKLFQLAYTDFQGVKRARGPVGCRAVPSPRRSHCVRSLESRGRLLPYPEALVLANTVLKQEKIHKGFF